MKYLQIFVFIITMLIISGCQESTTSYIVQFETNGGTKIENIVVEKNEAMIMPENPTKEGYLFKGWFLDDSFTTEITNPHIVVENITIYALWEQQDIEIDPDDLSNTLILFENERYSDYNFDIYLMDGNGENLIQVTDNEYFEGCPSFFADASSFVFCSMETGSMQLYMFDLNAFLQGEDPNIRQLTTEGNNYYPALSPDNSTIMFVSDRSGKFKIYTMDIYGEHEEILIDMDGGLFPSWSHDGTQIVFSAYVNGISQIFKADKNGENITRLTFSNQDDQFPSFSPDGEYIAFSTIDPSTKFDICIMDKDGNNLQVLVNHYDSDEYPQWSPDGNKIIFRSSVTGSNQITIMNVDGTEIEALSHMPGENYNFDIGIPQN